jgi:hypothetical protein
MALPPKQRAHNGRCWFESSRGHKSPWLPAPAYEKVSMAAKNYYVTKEDPEALKALEEDYRGMGWDTKITGNTLTVFATKRTKPVTKKVERPRRDRDDR